MVSGLMVHGCAFELRGLGVQENKMETTIVYWGYMGKMERKMETTVLSYIGFRVCWFLIGLA